MNIWVDADACPVAAKTILYKAAERTQTLVTFVANQYLDLPKSPLIKLLQVSQGFDVADDEIVLRAEPGDLVITSDIPLAAEVLEKNAHAITPRGKKFSKDSIKAQLNMRDFMDTMRSSGIQSGGPPSYGQTDKQAFANQLDRILARAR